MSKIIDLDALTPEDTIVKFAGQQYRVPGDMPMVTYLQMQKAAQMQREDASEEDVLGCMIGAVVDLLCWYAPDHDTEIRVRVEREVRRRGLNTLTNFVGTIYEDEDDDEATAEEADALPPAQDSSTTTSST